MKPIQCPYCKGSVMTAECLNTGVRFVVQCPFLACRHHFTVVEHKSKVDGMVRLTAGVTEGNRSRDGIQALTNLDSVSTGELSSYLAAKEDFLTLYCESIEQELDGIRRVLNVRRKKDKASVEARERVMAAAKTAQEKVAKKVRVESTTKLSNEQEAYRNSCIIFLRMKMSKGKITPEEGDLLIKESIRPEGLNRLSIKLGMDSIL